MQSATAAAPRSAREALFGDQQIGALQEDVNLNAIRYFVQMGWTELGVDTLAIPNMRLLRGEITPCRTYRQKANIVEIREADLIPNSEESDKDGRTVYGYYRRPAYYEAERLIDLETRAERQTGLTEIKSLRSEFGDEIYRKVNLEKVFFPTWPLMPEKNEAVIAHLETRLQELRNAPGDIPAHYVSVVLEVGAELLTAARRADQVHKHLLTYTHSCMKLTPKDEAFKRAYDNVDYEMLARTGTPQIHSEAVQTARALEKLTDHSVGGSSETRELIALLREQNQQQGELIQMLLAERRGGGQQQQKKG